MLTNDVKIMQDVFDELTDTTSMLEKHAIIDLDLPKNLKPDFDFILEVLAGKHPFGYTYECLYGYDNADKYENFTIKQMLEYLLEPAREHLLTTANISKHVACSYPWRNFFEPIVNRTLRLGIGKSLLSTTNIDPMLAKKYEGKLPYSRTGYYITEKLDGNRCIAKWSEDAQKWTFTSRNGKSMYVNPDMGNYPKNYVYDGEILSSKQTKNSVRIYNGAAKDVLAMTGSTEDFTETSGMINRHTLDKDVIFNIFDIVDNDLTYKERRQLLDEISRTCTSEGVRVLPILAHVDYGREISPLVFETWLNHVTSNGGEGIMINVGDAPYLNKRTENLLKFKQAYTMDMLVTDVYEGFGKYEGCVGSLAAQSLSDDGKLIECCVGSGLSDTQRVAWWLKPEKILGKIIEVAYFSLSKNKQDGSTKYSLRFPRLIKVREDKNTTSTN